MHHDDSRSELLHRGSYNSERSQTVNLSLLIAVVVLTVVIIGAFLVVLSLKKNPNTQDKYKDMSATLASIMKHTDNILSFGNRIPTEKQSTSGWQKTKNYIMNHFDKNKWTVELDTQTQDTVLGKVEFSNIIATFKHSGSDADRKRVMISAHYDSKIMKGEFLGATDSVVPCAMMLQFAEFWEKHPDASKARVDVQLVFFDGEEAFKEWTETDSLYGSRQLAQKWKKEDKLKSIDFMLLLDLIGAKDPTFVNFYHQYQSGTYQLFNLMSNIEDSLRSTEQLKSSHKYFRKEMYPNGVEDDHIPFLIEGVPVVHLISVPFPTVWHTTNDNRDALDVDSIEDIQKILGNTLVNYLLPKQS